MGLWDYLEEKGRPFTVLIELTQKCSFLCTHCYLPEPLRRGKAPIQQGRGAVPGLSLVQLEQLFDDLAASGTLILTLTGGEIFLRPDLYAILRAACQRGFAVKLFTNGYHITPKWAERLAGLNLYDVEVSIYGASETTYRAVTLAKNGYARATAAVRMLTESGVRTVVKTPVMRQNIGDVPAIKAFAEACGAQFRYDLVLVPRINGDRGPLRYKCDDADIEALLHRLYGPQGARVEQRDGGPHCAVGKWTAMISPEGEVFPCIEMRRSLGNVLERPFNEIWEDNPLLKRIRDRLRPLKDNPGTVFKDGFCSHCPALSERATGDMTKPLPEYQRVADIKRRFCNS